MLLNDLAGFGLYFGFIAAIALPLLALKAHFKLPFELAPSCTT